MAKFRNLQLVTVVAVMAASAMSLGAAGPRFILVTGTLLERPAVLDNWQENMDLMSAVTNPSSAGPAALANRPFYQLALFWGAEWVQYINEGRPVAPVKPEQGNQQARFYPVVGAAPALFVFEDMPGPLGNGARITGLVRSVGQEGLSLLARHGLRVRIESSR